MLKNIRAALRIIIGVPAIATLAAVQGLVAGPLLHNYTVIPNLFYNITRRVFGFKIEFNAASAPLVKDKPVWFVANHMSMADFILLGSTLNGTFAGKSDILKLPVVAHLAQTVRFIGLRRSSEFNDESRAALIKNFNSGFNAIMFPEGTTSEGKKVHLFRAALITILFGEKGVDGKKTEVALQKNVVVQPVAIRVKSVEGNDARGNDDLRNLYSMQHENRTLVRLWKRLQIRTMTLELTAFNPLNPEDFPDARALINKAALDIAGVVNPGQTTFEKANIPGPEKK